MPLFQNGRYPRSRSPIPAMRCLVDHFLWCRCAPSVDKVIWFSVFQMAGGEQYANHRPISTFLPGTTDLTRIFVCRGSPFERWSHWRDI